MIERVEEIKIVSNICLLAEADHQAPFDALPTLQIRFTTVFARRINKIDILILVKWIKWELFMISRWKTRRRVKTCVMFHGRFDTNRISGFSVIYRTSTYQCDETVSWWFLDNFVTLINQQRNALHPHLHSQQVATNANFWLYVRETRVLGRKDANYELEGLWTILTSASSIRHRVAAWKYKTLLKNCAKNKSRQSDAKLQHHEEHKT